MSTNLLRLSPVIATIVCGMTLGGTATPSAAASDSQAFIKDAIQGNLAEIAVGKLAQQKGGTDQIKSFGAMLVEDHTKANQQAITVAQSLGVALPTAPSPDKTALYQTLAKEPAAAFDTDFINAMLQDHQTTITAYQKAVDVDKDAAGQYAGQQLPALEQHLGMAQTIAKALGI